jgi:hypothetical protein
MEVARGRDELTVRKAVESDILSMPIKPTHQNKKTSKMKGGPNKLMKTNAKISDKTDHPNECMKTNELYKTADELPINYRKQT